MANLAVPLLFFLLSFTSYYQAALSLQSTPLFSPIQKDKSTSQYVITAYLQTPLQLTKFLLHLGAPYTWANCDNYTSSTYQHIPCNGSTGTLLGDPNCLNSCDDPPSPTCGNNSFLLFPENPIKPINYNKVPGLTPALIDTFALPTLQDGSLTLFKNFIFSCAKAGYLKGLAKGVSGLAALGRSNVSIPVQIHKELPSSPNSFAICLSSSVSQPGVLLLGTKGPYNFLPSGIDLSKSLLYTPLLVNPISQFSNPVDPSKTVRPSPEYYIGLTSIKINGNLVGLNQTLLAINGQDASGGTIISTVVPYTKLQTSIYKAVTLAFIKEASSAPFNLAPIAKPVRPFRACYPASDVRITSLGPMVPTIDLVLHRPDVAWKIYGSNSMVRITKKGGVDVWCLAFVDGGAFPKVVSWLGGPSIEIGGHQLEDNVLEFDLQSKTLGFSSSILSKGTSCANFKFSTKKA